MGKKNEVELTKDLQFFFFNIFEVELICEAVKA